MRVIAGQARGRTLISPAGERVRPTLDRVREALFNILASEVPESRFLDLFAGSGANGIEALSRGAQAAVFIDNHPESIACIMKNLATTGLAGRGRCLRYALPGGLVNVGGDYNVVFADPPHAFGNYEELLAAVARGGVLEDGGVMVMEHARKLTLPDAVAKLKKTQERHYGMTTLTFYA